MRNPGGVLTCFDPNATLADEIDSFTCAHDGRVVFVRPRENPDDIGGFCAVCSKLICSQCVGKGCDPLEEQLRRMEASYHARRSYEA